MSSPLPRVLVVDDVASELFLLSHRLESRCDVTCAPSGIEALEIARRDGPFDISIADMQMPEMDGAAFFEQLRHLEPDTIRILLTGETRLENAVGAINQGEVFRFLSKPSTNDELYGALDDAMVQHALVASERSLLKETLIGSVKALIDTLAVASPAAFDRAVRIAGVVDRFLDALGVTDRWEIEVAGMLSQLGAVTLPVVTLEKIHHGMALTEGEDRLVDRLPSIADRILCEIPRLEPIRLILDEYRTPPGPVDISFAGRVLRLAVAYETLTSTGTTPSATFSALRHRYEGPDLELLDVLARDSGEWFDGEVRELSRLELLPGMTLQSDIRSGDGVLVVGHGQVVTQNVLDLLGNFALHRELTATVTAEV